MIRVQEQDFDLGKEISLLGEGNHKIGGVCAFVGLVRELVAPSQQADQTSPTLNAKDQSMRLEHYPGMTEKMLTRIEMQAHEVWPLEASLLIHRFGLLRPGDQIVLVATASRHRDAAFESARYLMDFLKSQAPFWKCEEIATQQNPVDDLSSRRARWVDARQIDEQALLRWQSSLNRKTP